MDNNRDQLQGAQPLFLYQDQNQTRATMNQHQMLLEDLESQDSLPKRFSDLFSLQPTCFCQLESVHFLISNQYKKFYLQNDYQKYNYMFITKVKAQMKNLGVLSNKYSCFSGFIFKMIIQQFLEVHKDLKGLNKTISNVIPLNMSIQDLSQDILDEIFKSKGMYRKLTKIRIIWKKYRDLQQNQNRQRFLSARKIRSILYQQIVRYLKVQNFMTYLNFDEDVQKKLNQCDGDCTYKTKKLQKITNEIKKQKQHIKTKQKLSQIQNQMANCIQHQKFCKTIKKILDQNIFKQFSQLQMKMGEDYQYNLKKLLITRSEQERLIFYCEQLNLKVKRLQKDSQQVQQIKKIVVQNFQKNVLPQIKLLSQALYLLQYIQMELIKHQNDMSKQYRIIDQFVFDQSLYSFYGHELQASIIRKKKQLTPQQITIISEFRDQEPHKYFKDEKQTDLKEESLMAQKQNSEVD